MSTKLRQRRVESDGNSEKLLDVDFDDSKKVPVLRLIKRKSVLCSKLFSLFSMEKTLHQVSDHPLLIDLHYSLS